jgi:transcriptional regulator with XRE-family HTH domain
VNTEDKNTDKKRRAMMRTIRKKLNLTQTELAALAGVSDRFVAQMERGKSVSFVTQDRITGALVRLTAQRNPEAVNQAAKPFLEAAEKWDKVLSLEPGSELALEVEELNGKSLAELKAQAEPVAGFLRSAANTALSLTK